MLTYRRNTRAAEFNVKSTLNKCLQVMFMPVHADEDGGDNPPTPTGSSSQSTSQGVDLEKIIAQVRREEKDKLYGEISKLREENKRLKESNNGYISDLARYQERIDKAEEAAKSTNVDALNGKIKELEDKLAEAEKNKPDVEAIRKEIEAEYEVKLYAREQLDANKDKILSSFAGEVTGKTKEEVDASIKAAVEKSTAVKKELGLIDENGNPIERGTKNDSGSKSETAGAVKNDTKKNPKAVAPAKSDPQTVDADYIRSLDVNSEEYKEFRKSMGLK